MKINGNFKDLTDAHSYEVTILNAKGTESYVVDDEAGSATGTGSATETEGETGTGGTTGTGGATGTGTGNATGTANAAEGSGTPGVHVWWGENPVVIETKSENWEDVFVESKATVNLVTDGLLSGLYSNEVTDTTVEIKSDGGVLFKGYVEPRAYTQAFSEETNGVTVNCVDGLTALKYYPFRGVRTRGAYMKALEAAKMSSIKTLLLECLETGCGTAPVYYDKSKLYDGTVTVFDALYVNESLYLGNSYDNVKSCHDVVEDLLRYLGLHILETCGGVYIFSRESLGKDVNWDQIGGRLSFTEATWQWDGGSLSNDHLGGTDGSIDIGEVFNQVALTISPTSDSTVLRSPLESSGTLPALGGKVKYLSEYAADGEGVKAAKAFWSLVKKGEDTGFDSQTWKDWMVRPMRNLYWKMGNGSGPESAVSDWCEAAIGDGKTAPRPEVLVDKLRNGTGALLVSSGTVDHKPGTGDTSKQATVSMTTELVVSVNGNGNDSAPYPTDDSIKSAMPLASYANGDATAVYSPSDPDMRNYLVFAGSLILCPRMVTAFEVENVRKYADGDAFFDNYNKDYQVIIGPGATTKMIANLTPSRNNKDGRYLGFEWWQNGLSQGSSHKGWIPYTDDGPQEYEYKTSSGKDEKEKVDVLWCMLRIGSKVLVEDKTKTGGLDAFSWATYKTLSDCGNDVDEYLKQTFTIGVDPKIGDKMIGQEFQIGTNFDYTTNISAEEGMAIPLPYADKLHGDLKLEILGVDNGPWANYHKTRHATMFRHSSWSTDLIPLMAHVSQVIIKNFSVKFYSDGQDSDDDSDIVYLSRSDGHYSNKKEVSGSMVHSGFSSAEISAYSLNDKILRSTVCDAGGNAIQTIVDGVRGEVAKPEKLYVDELWQRLHVPRVTLTQTVTPALVNPWGSYTAGAIGKTLRVLGWKSNLAEGTCKATLTE